MTKLPEQLIIFPNNEKKFHEKWEPGRHKLNFPHPFRILLCSIQPHLGKTNWIWNILLHISPKFKRILLLHCGEDQTTEYDLIDYECLSELPEPTAQIFNDDKKTLLILEDKNFSFMNKEQLHRLDRLYGHNSTHRNLSIMCASQSFMDVPPSVRRMSNIYVLWYTRDLDSFKTIGRRCGLLKEELMYLVREYIKDAHDTIWIDCTKQSPYPLRRNAFELISIPDSLQNNIT